MLAKYGVLENNANSAVTMYGAYLSQAKPESQKSHIEIFEELKVTAQEEVALGQVKPEDAGNNLIKIPLKPKNCTSVFATYLNEMARKVNEKFFTTLIIFIRLYRDYMNLYGWDFLAKYRPVLPEDRKKAYTSVQDAEHVPEGCNDFIKSYLPKEFPNFDQSICVDMTFHLCKWLHLNGYTHTSISPL